MTMNLFRITLSCCFLFKIVIANSKCASGGITDDLVSELNKFRKTFDAEAINVTDDYTKALEMRTEKYAERLLRALNTSEELSVAAPTTPAPNVFENYKVYMSFDEPKDPNEVLDVWRKQKLTFARISKQLQYEMSSWGSLWQLVWKGTKHIACVQCSGKNSANKLIHVVVCGFSAGRSGIDLENVGNVKNAFSSNVTDFFPTSVDISKGYTYFGMSLSDASMNLSAATTTAIPPSGPSENSGFLNTFSVSMLALLIIVLTLVMIVSILMCANFVMGINS